MSTETPKKSPSEAQLAANRANAQKSTGPCTQLGKDTARFNAVRHNLTGRMVFLPTEDATLYAEHCRAFHAEFNPVGHREELLVQAIADHHWRLNRIPGLETQLFVMLRTKRIPTPDPNAAADSADVEIYLDYEKQLRNLHLQESRLTRYLKNDMAKLKSLQAARALEEKEQFELAATLAKEAKAQNQTFHPEEFGFVFSTHDIEAFTQAKGDLKLAKRLMKVNAARVLAQAA